MSIKLISLKDEELLKALELVEQMAEVSNSDITNYIAKTIRADVYKMLGAIPIQNSNFETIRLKIDHADSGIQEVFKIRGRWLVRSAGGYKNLRKATMSYSVAITPKGNLFVLKEYPNSCKPSQYNIYHTFAEFRDGRYSAVPASIVNLVADALGIENEIYMDI